MTAGIQGFFEHLRNVPAGLCGASEGLRGFRGVQVGLMGLSEVSGDFKGLCGFSRGLRDVPGVLGAFLRDTWRFQRLFWEA